MPTSVKIAGPALGAVATVGVMYSVTRIFKKGGREKDTAEASEIRERKMEEGVIERKEEDNTTADKAKT